VRTAGIVVVGGRSSRMGRSKAWLDWRGRPLLAHVVGIVREAVDGPVVVVGAPGQELPEVGAEMAADPVEGRGPRARALFGDASRRAVAPPIRGGNTVWIRNHLHPFPGQPPGRRLRPWP